MIFEIISGGEKTDWVGKEWAGLFFPRGKNGPAHSFPGEKTDWGEIPACYTGIQIFRCLFYSVCSQTFYGYLPILSIQDGDVLVAFRFKLEDLKVLRRSPDLFNNVKIGQGQLPLILIKHILFYHIWGLQPFRLSDLKQSYGYSINQPSDF